MESFVSIASGVACLGFGLFCIGGATLLLCIAAKVLGVGVRDRQREAQAQAERDRQERSKQERMMAGRIMGGGN